VHKFTSITIAVYDLHLKPIEMYCITVLQLMNTASSLSYRACLISKLNIYTLPRMDYVLHVSTMLCNMRCMLYIRIYPIYLRLEVLLCFTLCVFIEHL